ncbi:hypothetical protein DIPPA_03857 [Diplonema papillatum]|nr:hypothetical protein DIPPA_03857 [Diplonema papillatum]
MAAQVAEASLLQLARQARKGDKRNVARVLEGVQAAATGDLRLWADASLSQVVSYLARERSQSQSLRRLLAVAKDRAPHMRRAADAGGILQAAVELRPTFPREATALFKAVTPALLARSTLDNADGPRHHSILTATVRAADAMPAAYELADRIVHRLIRNENLLNQISKDPTRAAQFVRELVDLAKIVDAGNRGDGEGGGMSVTRNDLEGVMQAALGGGRGGEARRASVVKLASPAAGVVCAALAKGSVRSEAVWAQVSRCLRLSTPPVCPESLAKVAWSFSAARVRDAAAFGGVDAACNANRSKPWTPRALATLLWAFERVNHRAGEAGVYAAPLRSQPFLAAAALRDVAFATHPLAAWGALDARTLAGIVLYVSSRLPFDDLEPETLPRALVKDRPAPPASADDAPSQSPGNWGTENARFLDGEQETRDRPPPPASADDAPSQSPGNLGTENARFLDGERETREPPAREAAGDTGQPGSSAPEPGTLAGALFKDRPPPPASADDAPKSQPPGDLDGERETREPPAREAAGDTSQPNTETLAGALFKDRPPPPASADDAPSQSPGNLGTENARFLDGERETREPPAREAAGDTGQPGSSAPEPETPRGVLVKGRRPPPASADSAPKSQAPRDLGAENAWFLDGDQETLAPPDLTGAPGVEDWAPPASADDAPKPESPGDRGKTVRLVDAAAPAAGKGGGRDGEGDEGRGSREEVVRVEEQVNPSSALGEFLCAARGGGAGGVAADGGESTGRASNLESSDQVSRRNRVDSVGSGPERVPVVRDGGAGRDSTGRAKSSDHLSRHNRAEFVGSGPERVPVVADGSASPGGELADGREIAAGSGFERVPVVADGGARRRKTNNTGTDGLLKSGGGMMSHHSWAEFAGPGSEGALVADGGSPGARRRKADATRTDGLLRSVDSLGHRNWAGFAGPGSQGVLVADGGSPGARRRKAANEGTDGLLNGGDRMTGHHDWTEFAGSRSEGRQTADDGKESPGAREGRAPDTSSLKRHTTHAEDALLGSEGEKDAADGREVASTLASRQFLSNGNSSTASTSSKGGKLLEDGEEAAGALARRRCLANSDSLIAGDASTSSKGRVLEDGGEAAGARLASRRFVENGNTLTASTSSKGGELVEDGEEAAGALAGRQCTANGDSLMAGDASTGSEGGEGEPAESTAQKEAAADITEEIGAACGGSGWFLDDVDPSEIVLETALLLETPGEGSAGADRVVHADDGVSLQGSSTGDSPPDIPHTPVQSSRQVHNTSGADNVPPPDSGKVQVDSPLLRRSPLDLRNPLNRLLVEAAEDARAEVRKAKAVHREATRTLQAWDCQPSRPQAPPPPKSRTDGVYPLADVLEYMPLLMHGLSIALRTMDDQRVWAASARLFEKCIPFVQSHLEGAAGDDVSNAHFIMLLSAYSYVHVPGYRTRVAPFFQAALHRRMHRLSVGELVTASSSMYALNHRSNVFFHALNGKLHAADPGTISRLLSVFTDVSCCPSFVFETVASLLEAGHWAGIRSKAAVVKAFIVAGMPRRLEPLLRLQDQSGDDVERVLQSYLHHTAMQQDLNSTSIAHAIGTASVRVKPKIV